MHTPHNSQRIKYLWMAYVQMKDRHISKRKRELKENKEKEKYRPWKDKDEIKKPPDNWFWDWAIEIAKEKLLL